MNREQHTKYSCQCGFSVSHPDPIIARLDYSNHLLLFEGISIQMLPGTGTAPDKETTQ